LDIFTEIAMQYAQKHYQKDRSSHHYGSKTGQHD
jgi:hypothetical protein